MFVSCDTTNIDDSEEIFERNFPFTFRGGKLLCFEVSPDDVDADFDMSEYNEEFRGRYNLEKYSSLKAFISPLLHRTLLRKNQSSQSLRRRLSALRNKTSSSAVCPPRILHTCPARSLFAPANIRKSRGSRRAKARFCRASRASYRL